MKGFSKVLVPVDFSDNSRRAIERAVWLAKATGAQVELLHVAPLAQTYQPLDRWLWGDKRQEHSLEDIVRKGAQKDLDAFVASLPDDQRSSCSAKLEQGRAVESIVRVASSAGHDLIVMGTHGRSGARQVMLGSVAERVLRTAPCAVLVVP